MTDRYDTHNQNEAMTGIDEPDQIPGIDDDVFEKHRIVKMGDLGEDILEEEHERMDLQEMEERIEATAYQVCRCGNTLNDPTDGYKCANKKCQTLACPQCRIKLNRYNYCPKCVRKRFGLTRDLYIALYLLDEGVVEPVDLIGAGTVDGNIVSIEVDDSASRLLDSGLVRTDDTSTVSAAFDDDDSLTADGKEVLEAGEKLYGDEPDIEKLERKITIQQVADNGR